MAKVRRKKVESKSSVIPTWAEEITKREIPKIESTLRAVIEDDAVNKVPDNSRSEVYLGFGLFVRMRTQGERRRMMPSAKYRQSLMSLRVVKPVGEGGDYELLIDPPTFYQLKKFAKKYWTKKEWRKGKSK
jgi:hypothetical protein